MRPSTTPSATPMRASHLRGGTNLDVVAGSSAVEQRGYGDYLDHDERYARAEEFLAVCHAFWAGNGDVSFSGKYCHVDKGKIFTPFLAPDRSEPEIYVSGHSEQAQHLALTQAACYLRLIDTPE